jgi:aspartyl protease family protein
MPMKRRATVISIALWLVAMCATGDSHSVELQAILGKSAVLLINGERKMLRPGESFAGITLVATEPTAVTLDINGRTQTIGMSQRVATNFQQVDEKVVTIPRDSRMQYRTSAVINGRNRMVMVDTGASVVALSSRQAMAMGIDYLDGVPSQAETASGLTDAYGVILQSVSIGGIRVDNVPAMVIEGGFPTTVLLGMSYLQHVKMQEHNGILSLSRSH